MPYISASTTADTNDNFTDPGALQDTLLLLDFYTSDDQLSVPDLLLGILKGACIHEAERNVEMLLSTGRLDFGPGKSHRGLK